MEKQIEKIENRLSGIENKLDNHISEMVEKITSLTVNVAWLKKFFWVFMTPAVGIIVAALLYLVISK